MEYAGEFFLPETNSLVFTAGNQPASLVRVPVETKSFRFVTDQLDVGIWGTGEGGLKAVFCSVEDQNPAVDAECRNHVGVLRLIAGFVDLARVVNLLDNVHPDGSSLAAIATNLTTVLIVVICIRLSRLGDLDLGDLKVVGCAGGGVCAEKKTMNAMVLALGIFDVGEPLGGQGRPLQGGAENHVVEKRAVLLPCLVLLVDELLFLLAIELLLLHIDIDVDDLGGRHDDAGMRFAKTAGSGGREASGMG